MKAFFFMEHHGVIWQPLWHLVAFWGPVFLPNTSLQFGLVKNYIGPECTVLHLNLATCSYNAFCRSLPKGSKLLTLHPTTSNWCSENAGIRWSTCTYVSTLVPAHHFTGTDRHPYPRGNQGLCGKQHFLIGMLCLSHGWCSTMIRCWPELQQHSVICMYRNFECWWLEFLQRVGFPTPNFVLCIGTPAHSLFAHKHAHTDEFSNNRSQKHSTWLLRDCLVQYNFSFFMCRCWQEIVFHCLILISCKMQLFNVLRKGIKLCCVFEKGNTF